MKMKKGKGKIIIIAGVVLLLISAGAFVYLTSGEMADKETVQKGTLIQLVSDNGVIEAEETLTLTAKTSMEITKVYAHEGDYVNAGSVLLANNDKSASLDISSLRAQAAGIAAQAANANSVAENNKALYEAGAISQSEYNAARAAAAQLNSQLASLNYSIESFKQGAGLGGLVSPLSGYVTELFVKEGETIPAGVRVIEISPLKKFYIVLNLIPEDAVKVSPGDSVTIKQDDIILSSACSVERISKKAKEVVSDIGIVQKRIEVIIGVPKMVEGLIMGNNVDVEIITEAQENTLMVSSDALFEKESRKYVYLVEGGKAVLTEVEPGLEGDQYTEIRKGLKEGDVVILSPSNKITDGVQLK